MASLRTFIRIAAGSIVNRTERHSGKNITHAPGAKGTFSDISDLIFLERRLVIAPEFDPRVSNEPFSRTLIFDKGVAGSILRTNNAFN